MCCVFIFKLIKIMGFYDLSKVEREQLMSEINTTIVLDLLNEREEAVRGFFTDEDTYIRKAAYTTIGKLYNTNIALKLSILKTLKNIFNSENEKERQTAINAAGEIGKVDFESVVDYFDIALFDEHHSVRNAVIGSLKKMGAKNPKPTLKWAKKYLHHPNKEVRREICHGIELRGRTHPQDILPLLKELQHDKIARVRNTLIHVLGQIAYKKGCLETVISSLKNWENRVLVEKALDEIVDVHSRYRNFAAMTQEEAINYIDEHY